MKSYTKAAISTLVLVTPFLLNQTNAFSLKSNSIIENTISTYNTDENNSCETSILISQNIFDKADNVVIITGNPNINSFSASALASTLEAPILIIDNNLEENTISEIKRLQAKNLYILGNDNQLIKDITNKLNLNIISISGQNEYDTSRKIADEMKKKTPIKEVFLLGSNANIDGITLCSISAKYKIPILYTDNNNKLPAETEDFLKRNKLEKIYAIGNSFNNEILESIKSIHATVEVISGKDRYETNALLNNRFNPDSKGVIFIDKNNIVDAAPISSITSRHNLSTIIVNKNLTAKQKDYINTLKLEIVCSIGNVNKNPLLTTLNKINGISATSDTKKIFAKKHAVFYIPHQADETLHFSSVISKAIETLGRDNVFIVLITDGENSTSKQSLSKELTSIAKNRTGTLDSIDDLETAKTKIFTEARDNEFLDAVKSLGVSLSNVKLINGISDGHSNTALEYIKSIMTDYNSLYNGDITHITYTPYYDSHIDHRTAGKALEELYCNRALNNAYFVANKHYQDNIDKDDKIELHTTELIELSKFKLASESYNKWDIDNLRLSIGYSSDINSFKELNKDIKKGNVTSILHIPTSN